MNLNSRMYMKFKIVFSVLIGISLLSQSVLFAKLPATKYKIRTVFIDPGHGGSDPGSLGAYSHEADVALNISLKFGALIQQNYPDVKVVYARTTDQFVDLYERAVMANKCNADLFICIHCNSAGKNHSAYGSETYTMGLYRSDDNLAVAKRENSVILLEDDYKTKYQGFDPNDPASYIMLSMVQNANIDQSVNLAGKIQQYLGSAGRFDRGVKQAGFVVLVYTKMPSILVETGFITNPAEEKYLNSAEGSQNIAQSIFNGFADYKREMESAKTSVKENKSVLQNKMDSLQTINNSEFYKVQFYTSFEPLGVGDNRLQAVKGFTIAQDAKGRYIYFSPKYFTKVEAVAAQAKLKLNGFNDAFLLHFRDGSKVED